MPRLTPAEPARPILWIFITALVLYTLQPLSPSVAGIPLQVLLVGLAFALAALIYPGLVLRSPGMFSRWQWLAIVILMGVSLSRDIQNGMSTDRFLQIGTGIMIALLGGIFYRGVRSRSTLLRAMIAAVVVSCFVALLQWANASPWVWSWTKYDGFRHGSTGLETSPVPFGYSVVATAALLCCGWFYRWRCRIQFLPLPAWLLIATAMVATVGILASRSRSALLGLVLAIVLAAISRRAPALAGLWLQAADTQRKQTSFSTVGIIAIVASICLLFTAARIRSEGIGHAIGDPRMASTWLAYGPVILSNPFGIPSAEKVSEEAFRADIDRANAIVVEGDRLLSPHNILLSTGVNYGFLGPIAVVLLYVIAFWRARFCLAHLGQASDAGTAVWIVALCAANVAVLTHCWFHNANLVMGEMRNWLWFGMLAAVTSDVIRRRHPR